MTENNQNDNKPSVDNISDQLNELGKNLQAALKSAWESEERRKLQQEIEEGLANLGASLSQAARDFSNTPTGKTLKDDIKDLHDRWNSGEVGSKARTEISEALRKANDELQKATKRNNPPPTNQQGS